MSLVFDNIIFSLQRSGGGSRVWANIIRPHLQRPDCTIIEREGAVQNLYRKSLDIAAPRADHCLPLQLSRYVNFNSNFATSDRLIFHSSYFRVNRARKCINVTTVHDMIYEKFRSGPSAWIHKHQKWTALQNSEVIVCVSEHTKRDLLEFYPFCANKRLLVIPNGVDADKFAAVESPESTPSCRPYFLYIGHRGHLKGFKLVFDALDRINSEFECVVVGDAFTDEENRAIAQRKLTERVRNIGRISDIELARQYAQASFFFFPSLYEGFGLPPLEAMAAGCLVVAADRSSVPEVVGDAAILFNPDDLDSLNAAMAKVGRDSIRQYLINKGFERVKHYTWAGASKAYAELYDELLA